MTALTEQRIIGIRSGDRVHRARRWSGIPTPARSSPTTSSRSARPARSSRGRGWPTPTEQHPLDHPFAFALDPARRRRHAARCTRSTPARSTRWRPACGSRRAGGPTRIGHITDIEAFVPGEEPEVAGDDGGPADEPVTMMDYNASITYTQPGRRRTPMRGRAGHRRGPLPRPAVPGRAGASTPAARATARSTRSSSTRSTRSTCRRPARSPTSRSSRRCSTRARPRPSRSPGCTCCSTAPTCPRLPAADRRPERPTCASACGSPRCGRRDAEKATTAAPCGPRATSSAGCRPASPTSTTPTS